jgi:hypothetical protein
MRIQVLVGKPEARRPLGRLGKDGRIILKWNFKKWDWKTNWNALAQDRDRWQALVRAVMYLRIP